MCGLRGGVYEFNLPIFLDNETIIQSDDCINAELHGLVQCVWSALGNIDKEDQRDGFNKTERVFVCEVGGHC